MTSRAWRSEDIKGLTPAIDLRKSGELFLVGGQNFAHTSLGPKSIYGNRLLLPHKLGSPLHAQGIRIRLRTGTKAFIFEGNTILEWDEVVGGWQVLYITPDTNVDPYRWTSGYLNGYIYFCHPRVGIIVYDLNDGSVFKHEAAGVPVSPLAICVNMGRLCVLDDTYFTWSWQADGLNFTPSLGEAGAQEISSRIAGFPIMISNYGQGVVIWTTGGMMRSEFTGDQEVYRHRNLNTEYHPANSFCTIQTDENTIVILDERGLFQSSGNAPTPYAPLFNEFLLDFIRQNDLTVGDNLRLEWDDLRRLLYVMVSYTPNYQQYERAYVLYPPLDKWGVFNEIHHGILPLHIDTSSRIGDYFGFVDIDGRVRYWDDFPSRETLPSTVPGTTPGILNLRYPRIQKPTYKEEGGDYWIAGSSFILNSEAQQDFDYPAGYYAAGSNTAATETLLGLDSKIQIGLIRFPEIGDSYDRMIEVTHIILGNVESGPENQLSEDYLVVPTGTADEDYQTATGAEDFGVNSLAYVNHNMRIIGTVDGRQSFSEDVPELAEFNEAARHYACSAVGIWHILELSADDPGQAIHLRAFELNAVDAGRYG